MLDGQNIRMLSTQATFLPNKLQRVKVEVYTLIPAALAVQRGGKIVHVGDCDGVGWFVKWIFNKLL